MPDRFSPPPMAHAAETGAGSGPEAVSPLMIIPAGAVRQFIADHDPLIIAVDGLPPKPDVGGYLQGAILQKEVAWAIDSRTDGELRDLSAWSTLLGRIGVDGRRPVLLYDNGDLKFASRLRFLINYYGTDRAFLIDGGWRALQPLVAKGELKAQAAPSPFTPVQNHLRIINSPIRLAFAEDVRQSLKAGDAQIIDVRMCIEYIGTCVFSGIHRPGHIPGAINLPVNHLQTPQDLLLSPAELRAVFADYGIRNDRPLIFYCQDGARSSLAALAAVRAGYRAVNLYYQSFLGWQNEPQNEVITGGRVCPPGEICPH